MTSIILKSLEETLAFGQWLGTSLRDRDVLAMNGPLGVGKTTLVQGIARGLNVDAGFQVTSPTFVYLQIYQGPIPLYHVDLYRIETEERLATSGLMDLVGEEGVSIIEWYDRFPQIWDQPLLKLDLSFAAEGRRKVEIVGAGDRATSILKDWRATS